MPAFVKGVLSKFSAGLVLLLVAALLLAWPARHVLVPLWPGPVEELLYLQADGETGRDLVTVRGVSGRSHSRPLLARSRPVSLVKVEMVDGSWRHAYLLGVASSDDLSLGDEVPQRLLDPVVDIGETDFETLVLTCADGERFEVPASEVRQLIYPNRLAAIERLRLAWQRLADDIAERLPGTITESSGDSLAGTPSPR